jgi:hypothetical protein
MKKIIYLLLFPILLVVPNLLLAQAETFVFEGNNFRWHQSTNGSIFFNEEGQSVGLEVPINEENHSIFGSAFWIGGVNQNDELRISFRRFCQSDAENCTENWGPLKVDNSISTTEDISEYNKIWFVTNQQINLHNAYFDCVSNPNCDEVLEFPSYEIPEDFSSWPAEGEEGLAENLAPYVDRDGNGTYNPEGGDYPAICGDFSSYAIWNDLGTESTGQDGSEIGLEVHSSIYGYDSVEGSEFNTLFVQYKIINRRDQLLSNTYAGFWNDFELGNFSDDQVATDVGRSMIYVYNGDSFDEASIQGPGYGSDIAAMGMKVLSGPLAPSNGADDSPEYEEFYGNETSGWADGVIDNERLGLFGSLAHENASGPVAMQDPQVGIEYYNYMRSIWRDGQPMIHGGIGYSPGGPGLFTNYYLPGESDPLFAGTNGTDPNYPLEGGWSAENEGFPSADKRMLGSSGPFDFAPGDVQYIDLAYIFARESFDDEETVIETLQRFADEVEGMQCDPLPNIVLSTDRAEERKPLKVFPNPSNGSFSFELTENTAQLTLIDITGKVVRQKILNAGLQRIDVSDLADGIYIIQIQADQSVYHGKVVVEK